MGLLKLDDARRECAAWNAGNKVGTKRLLMPEQIRAVHFFLNREGCIRDRALFNMAIDSKLRGCDLVKIRVRNVVAWKAVRQMGAEMPLRRTS